MRGPDDIGKMQQPLSPGKVLGMRLLRPEALESDLVFGLFTCTAGFVDLILLSVFLNFGFAQLQAQSTRVHSPHFSIFHNSGFEGDATAANRGCRPQYLDFRLGHCRCLGDGVGTVVREAGEYVPQ